MSLTSGQVARDEGAAQEERAWQDCGADGAAAGEDVA